jgi:hypothetical protein
MKKENKTEESKKSEKMEDKAKKKKVFEYRYKSMR